MRWIDITGIRYGRLIPVRKIEGPGHSEWQCRCDCGNIKIIGANALRSGKVKSCGCLRIEIYKDAEVNRKRSESLKKTLSLLTEEEKKKRVESAHAAAKKIPASVRSSWFTPERLQKMSQVSRAMMQNSKEARTRLRTAENQEKRLKGIRASEICTGPSSRLAECWSLRTPDGRTFQFKCLPHFIATHPEEFTEDQLVKNRFGKTRAECNLGGLSPRRKRPKQSAYGWTWFINGEVLP